MSLLSIESLEISYVSGASQTKAVKDIDLTMNSGEILGVVGESGAGKSSIGLAVAGLLPTRTEMKGNIYLEDIPLHSLNETQWHTVRGKRMSIIFQEHTTSLNPLLTIEEHMLETLRVNESQLTKPQLQERISNLLSRVELTDLARIRDSYPHQLSGGQRQRVVIALALSANPALLIADEPVTALDVSTQYQIIKLLHNLSRSEKLAILLITHNMGVVSQITDKLLVMKDGNIVERGKTSHVLSHPKEDYSKKLIQAVPKIDSSSGITSNFEKPIIEIRNLFHAYKDSSLFKRSQKMALFDINLTVHEGESVGIVGESGSGKTTIAKLLTGIQRIQSGNLTIAGTQVKSKANFPKNLRTKVQMVFQDPHSSLNQRMTIQQHLFEALHKGNTSLTHKQLFEKSTELLRLVEMPEQSMRRLPREFSGGQKQRIVIARALSVDPTILICDEPTSALDVSVQQVILDLIKKLQKQIGFTLVFISHDLPVVQSMCETIVVLNKGKLVESANSRTFFQKPSSIYGKQLIDMIPSIHWSSEHPQES